MRTSALHLRSCVVVLGAWLGMNAAAAEPARRVGPDSRAPGPQIIDIALRDQVLTGAYVDHLGRPIDGALVTVNSGRTVLARTTTDIEGRFELQDVPSGAYRLQCGAASGRIRCWAPQSAPPNALTEGVTFQDGVVRGQAGMLLPLVSTKGLLTTAAAASAVVSGVSLAGVDLEGTKSKASTVAPEEGAGNSFVPASFEHSSLQAVGGSTRFNVPTPPAHGSGASIGRPDLGEERWAGSAEYGAGLENGLWGGPDDLRITTDEMGHHWGGIGYDPALIDPIPASP